MGKALKTRPRMANRFIMLRQPVRVSRPTQLGQIEMTAL